MAQQFTVWKREDGNTTPRGFGNAPVYSLDEPYTSDSEMIWAEPITCTLPEGYTVSESNQGTTELYDSKGQREPITDDHGHPAIITGLGVNKQGKNFVTYLRLDK